MIPRLARLAPAFLLVVAACTKESNPPSSGANAAGIDRLNKLVRGELSAVETYRQALEKEGAPAGELSALRSDHQDAAERLKGRVAALGGTASTESGPWGDFTRALEGTAKVLGNAAALSALQTGERHGVSEYEEALTDSALDTVSKDLIRTSLLVRQQGHEARLEAVKPK